MHFTSIDAQGLAAPPYFLSFMICILSTWIADKTQQRGLMIIGLSVIGGTGYIILATVSSTAVRYFAICMTVWPVVGHSALSTERRPLVYKRNERVRGLQARLPEGLRKKQILQSKMRVRLVIGIFCSEGLCS